jgi:16S rRNA (guanine(966)-N(2))-methyltransferase RsmD
VRIIAGRLKGRVLKGPIGDGVRPTSDRLRETLFNILALDAPGLRVLDGFAGTGAMGLEALSRGAAAVTFVERNPRQITTIRANAEHCGVADACVIIRDDFVGVARRHHGVGRFHYVLLDPPYDFPDLSLPLAEAATLLAPGGTVVLELSRRRDAPEQVLGLTRVRCVTAGDSQLAFYTVVSEAASAPPAVE